VHYLINELKKGIGIPYIDELREFSVTVRKSGISIGQCAQGFRMINILKNLGIQEGDSDGDNDMGNKNDWQYNEFHSFIEDTYKNCKREGVTPSIIPLWIKDLFDFYRSSLNVQNGSHFSLGDDSDDDTDFGMNIGDVGGLDNAQPNPIAARFDGTVHQQQQKNRLGFNIQEDNDAEGVNGDPTASTPTKENTNYLKLKQNNSSPLPQNSENKIPFVSQVSLYIDQKRKEIAKAREHQKKVKEEIGDLEFQKVLREQEVAKALKKEKQVTSLLRMFSELKKVLRDGYGISIDEGIKELAKLIHDFRENGYNVKKIIDEYTDSRSLKWHISENENKMKELQAQRNSLQSHVFSLESQVSMHRQTMSVFRELESMGFGLPELKQIWNTILEIAGIRKDYMSSQEAVSLFIRDIEENYHEKFLMEDKIKEKRKEVVQTQQELNNNRLALQLTPFVGTTLQHLFLNGIGENDIISINKIVTDFANGALQLDLQGEDIKDSTKRDESKVINGNNRAERWNSFMGSLRKLRNINSTIKKQQETMEKTRKEAIDLNKQNQDLSVQCQAAVSFIGLITKQIHHFNWLIDYYYSPAAKKIIASPTLSPLLINLVYVNLDSQHKDDKAEDGKK
jgi:hypothetical protein